MLLVAFLVGIGAAAPADAQLAQLVSPGPLTDAHAEFDGLLTCEKCHEPGRGITAAKCLACHKPVEERIAAKKGVHRNATDDCVACHVEHKGRDADLRKLDTRTFDHTKETGFALDGRHALPTVECSSCHKTRSYLKVTTTCASCHEDPHKGRLAATCQSCHLMTVTFKEWRAGFDHSKAAYPLTGSHEKTACEKCHLEKTYRGVKFASCANCHEDPHAAKLGPTCTRCHDTTARSWRTTDFDHTRTKYPRKGQHVQVACAKCHKQPAMKVKVAFAVCTDCHADVHKGTFTKPCTECHDERSFSKAPFDHSTTKFLLVDKHANHPCAACHKRPLIPGTAARPSAAATALDFKGLQTACASCHDDVHERELGPDCQTCHTAATFRVTEFKHPGRADFYLGRHEPLACEKCHVPPPLTRPVRTGKPVFTVKFKAVTTTCTSCHKDVHLGQVSAQCETCHPVDAEKFKATKFSHDLIPFTLTGKHKPLECAKCHKSETAVFPAGEGTTVRLTGMGSDCVSCHPDVHAAQLELKCERCHSTDTFEVKRYRHLDRTLYEFFDGAHLYAPCEACHPKTSITFPGRRGVVLKFDVSTECTTCHADPHRGSMGTDCIRCHKPLDSAERSSS